MEDYMFASLFKCCSQANPEQDAALKQPLNPKADASYGSTGASPTGAGKDDSAHEALTTRVVALAKELDELHELTGTPKPAVPTGTLAEQLAHHANTLAELKKHPSVARLMPPTNGSATDAVAIPSAS
jgi:hypothetical protein